MAEGDRDQVGHADSAAEPTASALPDDPEFTAGDVGRATGLSYRQINDWDSRGLLPPNATQRDSAWRRFTPRDIFVLLVLAELRREFNASSERLKFVRDFMTQDGANHLQAAADLMAMLGIEVWLMTDFEKTFVMDSELEFADMWAHGYFGGPKNSFAFVKVSPLVNKVLATLKEPAHLPSHGLARKLMADLHRNTTVQSQVELDVLQHLRDKQIAKLEVEMNDGSIRRINRLTHHDPAKSLEELLREADYQTVTVHMKDGRVVSVQQQESIKP